MSYLSDVRTCGERKNDLVGKVESIATEKDELA